MRDRCITEHSSGIVLKASVYGESGCKLFF